MTTDQKLDEILANQRIISTNQAVIEQLIAEIIRQRSATGPRVSYRVQIVAVPEKEQKR